VTPLSALDLMLAAVLVLAVGILNWLMRLRLERQLAIASVRTVVQLLLVGQVLRVVFAYANPLVISAIALFMVAVGGREIMARQQRPFRGWYGLLLNSGSLFVSSFSVTLFALLAIINNQPWYAPQYAIPLLGMLIGNTMTGIALSIDRLTDSLWQQRQMVEQRLLLGQPSDQAAGDIRRSAMRSGMIPIINSMAAAGLVSLPGMMTGQILSGTEPVEAVKYQILIMFLIAAGTGLGIMSAIWLADRRLFDSRHRLRLDLLGPGKR
jgi:putative ABC transport system permease protein